MANPEHLAKLKEGVEAWNQWRKENPDIRPDYWVADISGEELIGADLHGADLYGANLYMSNIRAANLHGADLSSTSLRWAGLSRADLTDADLSNADLIGADFSYAKLDRTNLTGAIVGLTTFANVSLSGAMGLESLRHRSPSSIDIDTIYLSKGKIPHAF